MKEKNRKKIVVAPFNRDLISQLKDIESIIETENLEDVTEIDKLSKEFFRLFCIKVTSHISLSELELKDTYKGIPLALFVPETGDLTMILIQTGRLRNFNMQVFFPADKAENIRDLRILSSLHIDCGFYLKSCGDNIDWDSLDDLFHYFAYTNVPKGHIEPFRFLCSKDYENETFSITAPVFNDPAQFVYIDRSMNIAESRDELVKGNFLGSGLEQLKEIINDCENRKIREIRTRVFIDNEKCSFCSAWRSCRMAYLNQCEKDDSYKILFDSILKYIDSATKREPRREGEKWQL